MANGRFYVVYVLEDPSGCLPWEHVTQLIPDSLGLTLRDSATGQHCMRWHWDQVQQASNDVSDHSDEMDIVTIVVHDGGAGPNTFKFECDDGEVILGILGKRRDAKPGPSMLIGAGHKLRHDVPPTKKGEAPSTAGCKAAAVRSSHGKGVTAPLLKGRPHRGPAKKMMVYDWDFVVLVPVEENADMQKFTIDRFTLVMLGHRRAKIKGRRDDQLRHAPSPCSLKKLVRGAAKEGMSLKM